MDRESQTLCVEKKPIKIHLRSALFFTKQSYDWQSSS